jgi:hypothetical protein
MYTCTNMHMYLLSAEVTWSLTCTGARGVASSPRSIPIQGKPRPAMEKPCRHCCTYVYMHVCGHMHIIYLCMCVCVHMYVCVYICVCVYTLFLYIVIKITTPHVECLGLLKNFPALYIYIYIYIYVCVCACMHIYVYRVCVCIYIYISYASCVCVYDTYFCAICLTCLCIRVPVYMMRAVRNRHTPTNTHDWNEPNKKLFTRSLVMSRNLFFTPLQLGCQFRARLHKRQVTRQRDIMHSRGSK